MKKRILKYITILLIILCIKDLIHFSMNCLDLNHMAHSSYHILESYQEGRISYIELDREYEDVWTYLFNTVGLEFSKVKPHDMMTIQINIDKTNPFNYHVTLWAEIEFDTDENLQNINEDQYISMVKYGSKYIMRVESHNYKLVYYPEELNEYNENTIFYMVNEKQLPKKREKLIEKSVILSIGFVLKFFLIYLIRKVRRLLE